MNAIVAICLLAVLDLGDIFSKPEAWKSPAEDFVVDHAKEGFQFASQKRDIVNCLKRDASSWKDLSVWEARLYYAGGEVKRIELSLYNRGDDCDGEGLSAAAFKDMLAHIDKTVSGGTKAEAVTKRKLKNGGFSFRQAWPKADPSATLDWGTAGGNANEREVQFVRLTLKPRERAKPKGATKPDTKRAQRAKDHVTKTPEGDVYVRDIPMVDQGQKGYCAAAVAERVMRYYGIDVDEHEVAQLAGTTAKGGTSTDAMKVSVRAIGSKFHLGYNEIVTLSGTVGDLEEDIERYNKAAKALKEKPISLDMFTQGNMIDVGAMRAAMKPKVLKQARTKDSRYKRFLTGVRKSVDQGVPVCWGVTLGIFPEPGLAQVQGGHMRLIIGYNVKTKEILYSDTWGSGHELKRMPEDWAFAITHDAFLLRPL